MRTSNKMEHKIQSDEIKTLYKEINDKVTDYLIENEMSMNENNVIDIFNDIASKTIKEKLIEMNKEFENLHKNEQIKQIEYNKKKYRKGDDTEFKTGTTKQFKHDK